MRFVLHQIWKDLCQWKWLIIGWASILVFQSVLWVVAFPAGFNPGILSMLNTVISILIIYPGSILLAWLITLSDAPASPRAFWRAKPVTHGQMMLAKFGVVFDLTVMLPLVIAWLTCLLAGMGASSFRVFIDLALSLAWAPLLAFAISAASPNLVRALINAAGYIGAFTLGLWIYMAMTGVRNAPPDGRVFLLCLSLAAAASIAVNWITRRTVLAYLVGAVLILLIPQIAGWNRWTWLRADEPAVTPAEFGSPDLKIRAKNLRTVWSGFDGESYATINADLQFEGLPKGVVPLVHLTQVEINGEFISPNTPKATTHSAMKQAVAEAAEIPVEQLQDSFEGNDPIRIHMFGQSQIESWDDDQEISFGGTMTVRLYQLRSIGEAPLALGEGMSDRGLAFKINSISESMVHVAHREPRVNLVRQLAVENFRHAQHQDYTSLGSEFAVIKRPGKSALLLNPSETDNWGQVGFSPFTIRGIYFQGLLHQKSIDLTREAMSDAKLVIFTIDFLDVVDVPVEIAPTTKAELFGKSDS